LGLQAGSLNRKERASCQSAMAQITTRSREASHT